MSLFKSAMLCDWPNWVSLRGCSIFCWVSLRSPAMSICTLALSCFLPARSQAACATNRFAIQAVPLWIQPFCVLRTGESVKDQHRITSEKNSSLMMGSRSLLRSTASFNWASTSWKLWKGWIQRIPESVIFLIHPKEKRIRSVLNFLKIFFSNWTSNLQKLSSILRMYDKLFNYRTILRFLNFLKQKLSEILKIHVS